MMDQAEKSVVNKAMLFLVGQLKITGRLKARLVSDDILADEDLEEIERVKDTEEEVFQLMQIIKRNQNPSCNLPTFISALRDCGQDNVACELEKRLKASRKDKPATKLVPEEKQWHETPGTSNANRWSEKDHKKDRSEDTASSRKSNKSSTSTPRDPSPEISANNAANTVPGPDKSSSASPEKEPSKPSPSSRSAAGPLAKSMTIPELRREIAKSCEHNTDRYAQGDIMFLATYYRKLMSFVGGQTDTPPEPLPDEIPRRIAYISHAIGGVNPTCALRLTQLVGGTVRYSKSNRNNCQTVITRDGKIIYVLLGLCCKPHGQDRQSWWLYHDATVRDAIAGCLGCEPIKIKRWQSTEEDREWNLDVTVLEYVDTKGPGNVDVWLE